MAKLHKQNDGSVPVTEMKDGDLAVITAWTMSDYIGEVVQRYEDFLISVGKPNPESWGEYFSGREPSQKCRVRILQPGELIEV